MRTEYHADGVSSQADLRIVDLRRADETCADLRTGGPLSLRSPGQVAKRGGQGVSPSPYRKLQKARTAMQLRDDRGDENALVEPVDIGEDGSLRCHRENALHRFFLPIKIRRRAALASNDDAVSHGLSSEFPPAPCRRRWGTLGRADRLAG